VSAASRALQLGNKTRMEIRYARYRHPASGRKSWFDFPVTLADMTTRERVKCSDFSRNNLLKVI
jgi:hypothetical protein